MRGACLFSYDSQAGLAILGETPCPKYFPSPTAFPSMLSWACWLLLRALVRSQGVTSHHRAALCLLFASFLSLGPFCPWLQAADVSAASKAFPDGGPSPELWVPLERWEAPRMCWALCGGGTDSWAEQRVRTLDSWHLAAARQ